MKKILLLPITLPLGMARGALEAAMRTTADALLDLTGGGATAQEAEAYAPAPAPPPSPAADAPVVDLDIAAARPRRRPAARPERPAPEPPAPPEPPATPQEVAEDLGLEEGRTEQEPDELVETEGAATPGPEITVDEPWPGYGTMRAADVVERLRAADAATKAIVRLYEQQHRKRRSVIAATA
jgi:hypothetical protein